MEKYPITFTYVPEDKYIPDYVIVEESYNTRQEYLPKFLKDELNNIVKKRQRERKKPNHIFKEMGTIIEHKIQKQILQKSPKDFKNPEITNPKEIITYDFHYNQEYESPSHLFETIKGNGKYSKAKYIVPIFLKNYYDDILESKKFKLEDLMMKENISEEKESLSKKIELLKEKIKRLQKDIEKKIIEKIKTKTLSLQTHYDYKFFYNDNEYIPYKFTQQKNKDFKTYEIKKNSDVYQFFIEKLNTIKKHFPENIDKPSKEKIKKIIQRIIKTEFEKNKLHLLIPSYKRVTHYKTDEEYDPEYLSGGGTLVETDKYGGKTYKYMYTPEKRKEVEGPKLYYQTYEPRPTSKEFIYDIGSISSLEEESSESEDIAQEPIKPVIYPGDIFDFSYKSIDGDSEIGFWLENVVYMYSPPDKKNPFGKRIYLLPSSMNDNFFEIIQKKCPLVKFYFQKYTLSKEDNVASHLEKIDISYDLRMNGERIFIPRVNITFELLQEYLGFFLTNKMISPLNISDDKFKKTEYFKLVKNYYPLPDDPENYDNNFYIRIIEKILLLAETTNVNIPVNKLYTNIHDRFFFHVNVDKYKNIKFEHDELSIGMNNIIIPIKIDLEMYDPHLTKSTFTENYIFLFVDGYFKKIYIFDPRGIYKYNFFFDSTSIREIYSSIIRHIISNEKYMIDWQMFGFEKNSFISFEVTEEKNMNPKYDYSLSFENKEKSLKWVLWFMDLLLHNPHKTMKYIHTAALIYVSSYGRKGIYFHKFINKYIKYFS